MESTIAAFNVNDFKGIEKSGVKATMLVIRGGNSGHTQIPGNPAILCIVRPDPVLSRQDVS